MLWFLPTSRRVHELEGMGQCEYWGMAKPGRPRKTEPRRLTRYLGAYTDEAELERFDAIAEALGISRSEAVRRLVTEFNERHADVLPKPQAELPLTG